MSIITGTTLREWNIPPGQYYREAIDRANDLRTGGATDAEIIYDLKARYVPPTIPMRPLGTVPYQVFLHAATGEEVDNLLKVRQHMDELMRVPTIVKGAVMPDACPSGSEPGTIPVGGAVACDDAIHPGFHSADICCSVAMTVFGFDHKPKALLDAVQAVTHFGPGGRPRESTLRMGDDLRDRIVANSFLSDLLSKAIGDFGTQGDGNHFAYVGRVRSTGELALVTHHGSRGLGAQLYKKGMALAKRYTAKLAPEVPSHNAWIKASSPEGEAYWDALQIVREWTKRSHYAIHNMAAEKLGAKVFGRLWNEHNFVFRRDDGLYYHGKGATPSWDDFAEDDRGLTLIPLNMAQPILIAAHTDNPLSLGFAPHGAGRNLSRTAFLKKYEPTWPDNIDVRFYCGKADPSELPDAYKDADSVRAQISEYGLGRVVDYVDPYGSIMAGDWEHDAPWRKNRAAKQAAKEALAADQTN